MKSLPYPTLQNDSDDYVNEQRFEAEIQINHAGANIEVDVVFTITEESILRAINESRAAFMILVKSSTTFFRTIKSIKNAQDHFSIDKSYVGSELEMTPYIIAKEEIDNFSSDNFNPNYFEGKLSIPKFGIMAMDDPKIFRIEKGDISITETICEFVSRDDIDNVEYSELGRKIMISLPVKIHSKYKGLKSDLKFACMSMFVTPVLVDIVNKYIVKEPAEEPADPNSLWYQCLMSKYKSCPASHRASAYDIVKWMIGKMSINAVSGLYANSDGDVIG